MGTIRVWWTSPKRQLIMATMLHNRIRRQFLFSLFLLSLSNLWWIHDCVLFISFPYKDCLERESSGGIFYDNLRCALASNDFIHLYDDDARFHGNLSWDCEKWRKKNHNTRVHKSHFLCHRTVITHILQLKHNLWLCFSPLFLATHFTLIRMKKN